MSTVEHMVVKFIFSFINLVVGPLLATLALFFGRTGTVFIVS